MYLFYQNDDSILDQEEIFENENDSDNNYNRIYFMIAVLIFFVFIIEGFCDAWIASLKGPDASFYIRTYINNFTLVSDLSAFLIHSDV